MGLKGLQEKSASNLKYLRIRGGNICEVSKEPREGWDSYEDKNGNTRYMKTYRALEAMITGIDYDQGSAQFPYRSWNIWWDADGTKGQLSLSCDSAQGSRFTKLVENIDLTKPVGFRVWNRQEDGKMKSTLIVEQDEKSIRQKYTTDNPGDMPQVKDRLGKKDFGDQEVFLHARTMEVAAKLLEMYPRNQPERVVGIVEEDEDGPAFSEPIDDEMVPF